MILNHTVPLTQLCRQGFIFVSLHECGFRTSSKASITHCDSSQAELPTGLPEQTGRPAQLCRWIVSGWTLHRGPRSRSNVSCRDLSPSRFPTIFLGFCLILGVKLHRFPGELCEAGPKCPCWEVSCHTKGAGHPAWLLLSHWRRCRLREALSPWFFPCLSGEEVTQSECNCSS